MPSIRKNLKYIPLVMFIFTNALIITESSLTGGASGTRSNIVSKIISLFVNTTIPGPTPTYVPVTSLSLKDNKQTLLDGTVDYTIPIGITRLIVPTLLPSNATEKGITYTSSNPEVVAVYPGGYLEARSFGNEVTISAQTSSTSVNQQFKVNVIEKTAPTNFEFNIEKDTIESGNTTTLNVSILGDNKNEYDVSKLKFVSSDESVASVNEYGIIKGISEGRARISAQGSDDYHEIKVEARTSPLVLPTSITLTAASFGYVYDSIPLDVSFDNTPSETAVTIVTDKPEIASIENREGKYFIKGTKITGNATITVFFNADFSVFATHHVEMREVKPTGITFNETSKTVAIGSSVKIVPILEHSIENRQDLVITNQNVIYTSSDESIARVTAGNLSANIVGIKLGEVIITATSVADPTVETTLVIEVIAPPLINDNNFTDFASFIRKAIGHFMLFFVDGIFGYMTFSLFLKNKKKWFIVTLSLSIGLFFAVTSEVIQLFTAGRTGAFSDVIIDFSGYLLATLLLALIKAALKKRKQKKEQIITY